jgi:RNA polymerase-binding transcription factor
MTPAGKGAQVKRVPASRSAATTTSGSGNKTSSPKVDATANKRSAPTKKKAAPVVKKAATAAKKPASSAKKAVAVAPKKAAPAPAKKSVTTKKAAPTAKKPAPAAKKAAPTKKAGAAPAAARKAADKPGAKKAGATTSAASKAAASANGAAAAPAARTTFSPKPKPPPPVRPKTGPYAKDTKFLDEVRELLQADRAIYQEQATSLRAEADSLALEREPGDVQFDEESGEGGTVTVDRERNLALSGQAMLAVEEIDDALRRIDDKTYGYCERCFQPIPKPRLRALPYARLCVACKSGGLSRR